jgi:hypothetical protein
MNNSAPYRSIPAIDVCESGYNAPAAAGTAIINSERSANDDRIQSHRIVGKIRHPIPRITSGAVMAINPIQGAQKR